LIVPSVNLHTLVRQRNLAGLRAAFATTPSLASEINAYDAAGYTPLMLAVGQPQADKGIINFLLDHGADVHQQTAEKEYTVEEVVMSLALGGGDPKVVERLLQAGGDIRYQRAKGYTALLHAVHGRDIMQDERLLDLLRLLIAHGVDLNSITSYAESGLRVLSNIGRFDAVKLLLEAGADENQLGWTSLLKAIALGSVDEVKTLQNGGASLGDRDWWERTPWLLALQTGDIEKARFLYEAGADTSARGRCGKPSLFYAIESRKIPLLHWLLRIGADVEQTDDFGETPLMVAVEHDALEAIDVLLAANVNLSGERCYETALKNIQSRGAGMRLLQAGAIPSQLSHEGHRILVGLGAETGELTVSVVDFNRHKHRIFGTANPERMTFPFWEDMIRAGINAFSACQHFASEPGQTQSPVWCADRFGQSITFLPDGRTVQIAGEHEDYYDPDFCIYNDVFVHHPNGSIEIFGYPEADFPPTDFHTATLMSDGSIWIVGSLGYIETRRQGETPVYRLDTTSMRIERIEVSETGPGWISRHAARILDGERIEISGGEVSLVVDGKEFLAPNETRRVLDTARRTWIT
jgi:ankyrin repeat protein